MSIIREIKAALRRVFNIKDEVKQESVPEVKAGYIFEPIMFFGEKVIVLSVDGNRITFREKGCVGITDLRNEEFLSHYRKIS